jgi:hypothetical protein
MLVATARTRLKFGMNIRVGLYKGLANIVAEIRVGCGGCGDKKQGSHEEQQQDNPRRRRAFP